MNTKFYSAKIETKDAEKSTQRRFRNILANSGEIMESGEVRSLEDLYVMGFDSELYKISDLNTDPEKQTEKYAVKAQADHGELIDGELIPSIEKQFGSCKVWLEDNGLHARMYFASEDKLADHAWAISEDASYSTGIDWYPDGYYGAGHEIEEPIGILREISMVLTGNDPRAMTIDTKSSKDQRVADDGDKDNKEERKEMSETKDNLTPDERDAFVNELTSLVEKFTTDAPEDETRPTADAEGEEKAEKAETKDAKTVNSPVVVIRDRVVKNEKVTAETKDWLRTPEARQTFADTLRKAGKFGASFDAMWSQQLAQHKSLDGISGLPTAVPVDQMFISTLENSDGIISHFSFANSKSYRAHILYPTNDEGGRAKGHKKGDTKALQAMTDVYRDVLVKMVYKKLDLDATEIYENPELIDFRAQELVNAVILEIERAAIIGDGRSEPDSGADYRMFDGTRGFYSIKTDAANTTTSAYGYYAATTYSGEASNLYDAVVGARGLIKTEGRQFLVAKSSAITSLLQAKVNNNYLVAPGARIEDILQVERVYTPQWMDNDTANDAYLIVDGAYRMIGDRGIRSHADFDITNNTDVLLTETPRGGSLASYRGAVAIAAADSE